MFSIVMSLPLLWNTLYSMFYFYIHLIALFSSKKHVFICNRCMTSTQLVKSKAQIKILVKNFLWDLILNLQIFTFLFNLCRFLLHSSNWNFFFRPAEMRLTMRIEGLVAYIILINMLTLFIKKKQNYFLIKQKKHMKVSWIVGSKRVL